MVVGLWASYHRAKISGRLFQVDLLDAQARSSRVSMLLPGSLVLAETELRCSFDHALLGDSFLRWPKKRGALKSDQMVEAINYTSQLQ